MVLFIALIVLIKSEMSQDIQINTQNELSNNNTNNDSVTISKQMYQQLLSLIKNNNKSPI